MSKREEYAKIVLRHKECDEERTRLDDEARNLRQEKDKILSDIILEEKIFEMLQWTVAWDSDEICALRLSSGDFVSLASLSPLDFERGIDIGLADGVDLYVVGSYADIHFSANANIFSFMKKFSIKISEEDLSIRKQAIKNELASLEQLEEMMKG